MPNWCQNVVTFTHSDPAEIKRMEAAFARGEMMQEFVPCPEELNNSVSPAPEEIAAANIEKYGFSSWYDWKVANWGTKWDVGDSDGINTVDENSILVYFDSAWSPPTEFYEALHDKGWGISAYYYEPGMAYTGWWENGDDESFEITGNSDWVVENIPEQLDDMFQISANMEVWEDETETETDNKENE